MLGENKKNQDAAINKFISYLRSKRYSENTIKTYSEALRVFMEFHNGKMLDEIDERDFIKFNTEYIIARGLSTSYQNQVVNAIKLFFRICENKKLLIEQLHRPRREKKLPNVLSKEEVKKILEAPMNLKHRVMLSLIYSCGLRCGELLNMKPVDIDSKRMLVHVRLAKGKKDRIVPLSEKVLLLLREYYQRFKPRVWLFEGQRVGEKYSERSLQLVLKHAIEKAVIKKPVSLHWLKHSYATHLLESGTEIYTHVSTKSIQNIKSPFDDL